MKSQRPQRRQPTPQELRDELMRFIQTHFYPGRAVDFAKDTPRLLSWVVLKLAAYLDERAVTISLERYLEIMRGTSAKPGILMEALQFGDTGNISYLPAYLGKVVESHLRVHGEDYYEEGKAIRGAVDNALTFARGGVQQQQRNPVQDLADAARLLKGKKRSFKTSPKAQLPLL